MTDALLDAKLALERELVRPITHIMLGYLISKQDGEVSLFNRAGWSAQTQSVLLQHYVRVVMVVTGRRPKRVELSFDHAAALETLESAALSFDHAAALKWRAVQNANRILGSIDNEWNYYVETKDDPGADMPPDARGLYTKLNAKAREIWRRIRARIGMISTTETNGAAEDARIRQARELAGNRLLYKRWSTMRDERVRDTHRDAEGQEQLAASAFDVGVDQLMFPGDQSLGASLSEIINCRCSAEYFVRHDDGTIEDLAATPRLTPVAPNRALGSVDHPSLVTRAVQLRTGMITRVFLGDMIEARVSIRDGIIRVTRAGRRLAIGRYTHGMRTGSRVQGLQITTEGEGLGISELIERSVAHTNGSSR
jgi:hypothetical protein